ncbi:hypothetical protein ACLIYP_28930, partial [Streptomyces nanhaiensis]
MSGQPPHLVFADPGEAAELAALLGRLLRWEKAAAVRLRAAGDGVLGVFARPARFEVLAVRTARLAGPAELDATVSAGELLEGVDEASGSVSVPAAVTGRALRHPTARPTRTIHGNHGPRPTPQGEAVLVSSAGPSRPTS